MSQKNVFAENLDALINKFDINVKALVHSADGVTYGYVMRVRRGENCPTINKAEIIVKIIKRHHSTKTVEFWMFFVPDYFADETSLVMSSAAIQQVSQLLCDADKLGILKSTPDQRASVETLASLIYKRTPAKI